MFSREHGRDVDVVGEAKLLDAPVLTSSTFIDSQWVQEWPVPWIYLVRRDLRLPQYQPDVVTDVEEMTPILRCSN